MTIKQKGKEGEIKENKEKKKPQSEKDANTHPPIPPLPPNPPISFTNIITSVSFQLPSLFRVIVISPAPSTCRVTRLMRFAYSG